MSTTEVGLVEKAGKEDHVGKIHEELHRNINVRHLARARTFQLPLYPEFF